MASASKSLEDNLRAAAADSEHLIQFQLACGWLCSRWDGLSEGSSGRANAALCPVSDLCRSLPGRYEVSALRKRLLDDELARLAVIAFDKTLGKQQRPRVADQSGTTADHGTIMLGRERGKIIVTEQFARGHQVGDPAAVVEWVARDGRIINKLVADQFTYQIVLWQFLRDHLAVGEFGDPPAAVNQYDLLEALVGLRILDDAEERR